LNESTYEKGYGAHTHSNKVATTYHHIGSYWKRHHHRIYITNTPQGKQQTATAAVTLERRKIEPQQWG
jgi:hypothetical protein